MKSFLKWGGIALGLIVALVLLNSLELETQRWLVLGGFLGVGYHGLSNAVEKARLDTAQRLANLEYLVNQIAERQHAGTRALTEDGNGTSSYGTPGKL